MTTNVYECESKIYFDPDSPSSFYGFYVKIGRKFEATTSHFPTVDRRQQYIRAVGRLISGVIEADPFRISAYVALCFGDEESYYGNEMLVDELYEHICLERIGDFDSELHKIFDWYRNATNVGDYLPQHIDEKKK